MQKVVSEPGQIRLFWDVAMDLNGVEYAIYYSRNPFDFNASNPFVNATRIVRSHPLTTLIGSLYCLVEYNVTPS